MTYGTDYRTLSGMGTGAGNGGEERSRRSGQGLRHAVMRGGFIAAPGCYDALSARLAERHGFEAVYMSGLAVTASLLAKPDLELLGMAEMVNQASLICSAVEIPVIADADTGYGGLANVQRTVRAYLRAGAAAIHLEDQASPKRCGHLGGVRLIEEREMTSKLEAALEARGDHDMLIIGRTDAFKAAGLEEAIGRARRYAETGVDLLFVDGLTEPDDFRTVRAALEGPLMASIVEMDGPALTQAALLKELGYSIAVYALSSIEAAAHALDSLMADIRHTGTTDESVPRMMTYSELNATLDIGRFHELWDRHASDNESTT